MATASTTAAASGGGGWKSILDCSICFEKFVVPKVLPCGHSYCESCLTPLIKSRRVECPRCRKPATEPPDGFPTNFDLMHTLDTPVDEEDDDQVTVTTYNCSTCTKVLSANEALLCKECHDRILCLKCYAAQHGAHGGIVFLQPLLDENRHRYERAREKLSTTLSKFKSPETESMRACHGTIGAECADLVISTNELISGFVENLSHETSTIETQLANTLESLTISKSLDSFVQLSTAFDDARFERTFAYLRKKLSNMEEMLRRAAAIDEESYRTEEQPPAANMGNYVDPEPVAQPNVAQAAPVARNGWFFEEFVVESMHCGMIIGKGGARKRLLEETYNCRISIDRPNASEFRTVKIQGRDSNMVNLAKMDIMTMIEQNGACYRCSGRHFARECPQRAPHQPTTTLRSASSDRFSPPPVNYAQDRIPYMAGASSNHPTGSGRMPRSESIGRGYVGGNGLPMHIPPGFGGEDEPTASTERGRSPSPW